MPLNCRGLDSAQVDSSSGSAERLPSHDVPAGRFVVRFFSWSQMPGRYPVKLVKQIYKGTKLYLAPRLLPLFFLCSLLSSTSKGRKIPQLRRTTRPCRQGLHASVRTEDLVLLALASP